MGYRPSPHWAASSCSDALRRMHSLKRRGTTYLDERRYTRIERSLTLPRGFDESKAKARLEDGVLHLEAPRTEASTGRRVDIA
jgi:HSP20 family molecular chaperone IbpA